MTERTSLSARLLGQDIKIGHGTLHFQREGEGSAGVIVVRAKYPFDTDEQVELGVSIPAAEFDKVDQLTASGEKVECSGSNGSFTAELKDAGVLNISVRSLPAQHGVITSLRFQP